MRGILCLLWLASAGMASADSHFSSWADFDGYVQAQYDQLAQGQAFAVFPPSDFHFGVSRGVFAFNAGEMPEITNSAPPEIIMEAPSWQVRVRETSDATRLFIAEVHGVGVRTNGVSAYDAQAWARDAYGDPPEWLDGDGLAAWYAERSRERAELCLTLIPSGHYGTYLANRSAAAGYALGAYASPTVLGGIAGAAIGAHGVDNFQAGARKAWTGKSADTMTSQMIQSAGVSQDTANMIDAGISVIGSTGASAATRAAAQAPVALPITQSSSSTTANLIMNAERVGSGLKADVSHRAASFLSEAQLNAGQTFTIKGGDGVSRVLLQTNGKLNGKSGIFEYILDPSGKVPHQRFIQGGTITGFPNQ